MRNPSSGNARAQDGECVRTVILTIGRLSTGGAEMRLLDLLRHRELTSSGIKAVIYVVSGRVGELDEKYKEAGVRIVYGSPGLRGLKAFYRLCKDVSASVVHINAELAAGFYGAAALAAGVKIRIAHLRSMKVDQGRIEAIRQLAYAIVTNIFCSRIVCVSYGAIDGRLILRNYAVVYNGLPVAKSASEEFFNEPIESDCLRLIVFGRLAPLKNCEMAIMVVAEMMRLAYSVRLSIVGPDAANIAGELTEKAVVFGVSESVQIVPTAVAPEQALYSVDVLLLPSLQEGLPGVVLEALVRGIPVVAHALPGVVEISRRTKGVHLVDVGADVDEWLSRINLARTECRGEIAESFRRSVFTLDRHVQEMIDIWKGKDPVGLSRLH